MVQHDWRAVAVNNLAFAEPSLELRGIEFARAGRIELRCLLHAGRRRDALRPDDLVAPARPERLWRLVRLRSLHDHERRHHLCRRGHLLRRQLAGIAQHLRDAVLDPVGAVDKCLVCLRASGHRCAGLLEHALTHGLCLRNIEHAHCVGVANAQVLGHRAADIRLGQLRNELR